jgi:hypothetical protein
VDRRSGERNSLVRVSEKGRVRLAHSEIPDVASQKRLWIGVRSQLVVTWRKLVLGANSCGWSFIRAHG